MSQLVFHLPGNGSHSNVSARKRREYLESLPEWIELLASAGFPVAPSFQGIDLKIAGVHERMFVGTDLLSAPFAHTLPSIYEQHPVHRGHAEWLFRRGAIGSAPGTFVSEFDIPRRNIIPRKDDILFALPSQTVGYSECSTGDVNPGADVNKYEAIRFHDKVIVPMRGVEAAQKAFFAWQKSWTDETLEAAMSAIASLAFDGKNEVYVLFLDLEAPLVGSHHGIDVWRRYFEAIRETNLAQHFIPFKDAATLWRSRAVDIEGSAYPLFARQLGAKWTGLQPQIDYLMRASLLPEAKSDREHAALSLVTTSDVLSAMDRKLRRSIWIDGDLGKLEIGYDQTIISVALAVRDALEHRRSPIKSLRALGLDEDSQWFVNRIADVLTNMDI